MEKPKIFFSYSRDDSEFVLNLAKELRSDGANVWLDQLDIKPGTRWDKSIEDALDTSKTVLVVLSKTSVESNNVMDEVSYALEEGKTVIPVLLEECDIPFRLRRLQFADFSISHEKGIQKLTKALGLTDQEAAKPNQDVEEPKEPITEPQIAEEKPTTPRDTVRVADAKDLPSKKSKLPIYIGGGIIVLVLVIMYALGAFSMVKSIDKLPSRDNPVELVQNEKLPTSEILKIELKSISKRLKFEPDGYKLAGAEKELDQLVAFLKKYPHLKLNIECHVHDQGSRLKNASLSKARAEFLQKTFASRDFAANRVNSLGFGESKPIASNNTREGRAANTRVEMTLSKS